MDTQTNNSAELLRDFADEAMSALHSLPGYLESYQRQPDDLDPINAVFRTIHSIKGNASFFGLVAIKTFAHSVENSLDAIRTQNLPLSDELKQELIASIDIIDDMIGQAQDGSAPDILSSRCEQLLTSIAHLTQSAIPDSQEHELSRRLLEVLSTFHISGIETPRDWLAAVLKDHVPKLLAQIADGQKNSAQILDSKKHETLSPLELSSSKWQSVDIDLANKMSAVLELFLAVDRGEIVPDCSEQFVTQAAELAEWAKRTGRPELAEVLNSAVTSYQAIVASEMTLDTYLAGAIWEGIGPEISKLTLVDSSDCTSAAISPEASAVRIPASKCADKPSGDNIANRVVRVKEERLDEFLNRVSRLFITGEMLKDLQARMVESGELRSLVEELRQIVRSFSEQATALQQGLFALRRVSVAGLFSKFPRMARTLGEQLGKKVDVQVVGEDVELDKALIEDLDAPLTHILRNALDHGIDKPSDRAARGVPEVGRVTLIAELTRTHARILVRDDGLGIDPDRLRAKAREKGLYSREQLAAMSDSEVVDLIFDPGFSTAEKLSDVSGRGVGLDVVRTSIRKHNGDVTVSSELGVGTTFTLQVPLREAVIVIDGLMVRHCDQEFVIPFEFIREICPLDLKNSGTVQGSPVVTIRDKVYAAKSLDSILAVPSLRSNRNESPTAVLVGTATEQFCMLVDQVRGNRKVVVNSLSGIIPGSTNIAGVAQLGGGKLALVLSVLEIAKATAGS